MQHARRGLERVQHVHHYLVQVIGTFKLVRRQALTAGAATSAAPLTPAPPAPAPLVKRVLKLRRQPSSATPPPPPAKARRTAPPVAHPVAAPPVPCAADVADAPHTWDTMLGDLTRLSAVPDTAMQAVATEVLNPTPHPLHAPQLAAAAESAASEATDVRVDAPAAPPLRTHAPPLAGVSDAPPSPSLASSQSPFAHAHPYATPLVHYGGRSPVLLSDAALRLPRSPRASPGSSPRHDDAAAAALRTHLASLCGGLHGSVTLALQLHWRPGSHRVAIAAHPDPTPDAPSGHYPWHALDALVDADAWAGGRQVVAVLWPPLATDGSAASAHAERCRATMRALVGLAVSDSDSPVTLELVVRAWQAALEFVQQRVPPAAGARHVQLRPCPALCPVDA